MRRCAMYNQSANILECVLGLVECSQPELLKMSAIFDWVGIQGWNLVNMLRVSWATNMHGEPI